MSAADVAYRIATDAEFATQVQEEPHTALAAAFPALDPAEIKAVLAVLRNRARWIDLCSPTLESPDGMPQWWPAKLHSQSI